MIALALGQYIPPLKDDENAETPEQIAKHLQQYARFDQPSEQQLTLLAQVVRIAKSSASPAPAPTVPVTHVEESTEAPVAVETVEPEAVEDSVTNVEVPAQEGDPTPAPAPTPKAVPATNYDPNDFNGYSPMKDRNEAISVDSDESGKQQVSWMAPADGTKVYLVSASNDVQPSAPGDSAFKLITANNKIDLPQHFRYITVFEFDGPRTRGSVFGSIETVGAIEKDSFELEAFSTQVRMRWVTKDTGAEVRIARSKSNEPLPADISPSFVIYEGGPNSGNTFVDESVQPGDKFEYRIWLQRVSGGRVGKSEAETKSVSIPGAIPKIENFTVSTSEKGPAFVNISYKAPTESNAKVLIYQVQGAPSADLMAAIADTEIKPRAIAELTSPRVEKFLGKQIIEKTPRAVEGIVNYEGVPLPTEEIGSRTFIAVVTLGDYFRIGETHVVDQIGNVNHAEIIDRYDYQLLRVELPDGADFIQVWHTGMGQTWDSIDKRRPTRNVDIGQEYRPNGGVLFTKPNPTLPAGISELGVDPAKLFIVGATVFNGKPHISAEPYELLYKGRIEVHVMLEQAAPAQVEKRGLFGRGAQPAAPAQSVVKFKIIAPPSVVGRISLQHLQTRADAGLPINLGSAIGQIHLDVQKFKDWAQYPTGQDGISGPPLAVPNGMISRFVPMNLEYGNIPIFVVEEKIEIEKAQQSKTSASSNTYKVIMVGAKRSGKTTYVQAFLHYLENQYAQRFGSRLVPNPESVAAKFRLNGLHAFLDSGELPPSTPSAKTFGPRPATQENDPRIPIKFDFIGGNPPFASIELFDVAGEDMDSLEDIALYSEELAAADLVIYLFDPLQLEAVANVLTGVIAIPERGTDPFEVLVNLSTVMGTTENRNPRQKIAVAISKFDGLVAASSLKDISHPFQDTISSGMSVTRDPNSWDVKKFNKTDSWNIHQEVKALLSLVPALNPFVTAVRDRFGAERTRLFVVSALGHSTFAAVVSRAGITSFRVSDPIMWLVNSIEEKAD